MLGSRKNITDGLKVQLGYRVESEVSVCSAKIETNSPILLERYFKWSILHWFWKDTSNEKYFKWKYSICF